MYSEQCQLDHSSNTEAHRTSDLMPSRATPLRFVEPMALLPVRELPQGAQWLYEVKLDGYSAVILKSGERVEIRSRNDRDLTRSYPQVAEAGRQLKAKSAVVDGEIVALDPRDARPSKRCSTRARTRTTASSSTPSTFSPWTGQNSSTSR